MNEFIWKLVEGFMPALITIWTLVIVLYIITRKNRK